MTEQGKELLTVNGLAERLKVKPVTIYRQAKAGKIPHRKIGRAIRFAEEDVQAYLQSVQVGGQCTK
jgi:excisionase family DNA binding protein